MELMARICLTCFTVRGRVTSRTSNVNRIMAMPIWLKLMTYNTIKVLSIGRIMNSVQKKSKASKKPYLNLSRIQVIGICCSP